MPNTFGSPPEYRGRRYRRPASAAAIPLLVQASRLHSVQPRRLHHKHILDVHFRLAIGQQPVAARLRPNETDIQRVEVEQRARGKPVQEQIVPGLGPRIALAPDGQPFGKPVRTVEIGLLERDDVDHFMCQHPGPVHRDARRESLGEAIATIRRCTPQPSPNRADRSSALNH